MFVLVLSKTSICDGLSEWEVTSCRKAADGKVLLTLLALLIK